MTTLTKTRTLEQLIAEQAEGAVDVLTPLRRRGAERFALVGFPTSSHEEWKYTNTSFTKKEYALPVETFSRAGSVSLCGDCSAEFVFVNGRYSAEASSASSLPPGLSVTSMRQEQGRAGETLTRTGTVVESEIHPFAAMNEAMVDDVLHVRVAAGSVVAKPLHIVFLSRSLDQASVINHRLLIEVERGAQVSIVETYHGEGDYFSNSVTELIAGDGAVIDHNRVIRESPAAVHIGNFGVRLERNAAVKTRLFSFGGSTVRNELLAFLDGEGADLVADGLYVAGDSQRIDNHTVIEHRRPHTNSLEMYKGILDDKSSGAFDGKIVVHKGAQKTTSRQTNRNLLLSNEAIADSKPQLEIYADDVKCNHGSTIGQLDEDALFYLQSRGIRHEDARSLLTFAFAREIIDRVDIRELRTQLETELLHRVPPAGEIA